MKMKSVRFEVGLVTVEARVPEGVDVDLDLWVHSSGNTAEDAEAMLAAMEPGMDPDAIDVDRESVKYKAEAGDDTLSFYVYLRQPAPLKPEQHPVGAALLERRRFASESVPG